MRVAALAAVLALVLLGSPIHAAEDGTTEVSLSAVPGSGTVAVSGEVLYGPDVWDDVWAVEGSGGGTVPSQFGTDIVGATITSDPSRAGHLTFAIGVSEMPPTGTLPEAVIYGWDILVDGAYVDGGSASYLEWRRSNVTGVNASVDPFVRLRTCVQNENGGNTCSAGPPLEGGFYPEDNELRATIAFGRRGFGADPGQALSAADITIFHGTGLYWLPGTRSDIAYMDSDYVIPGRADSVQLALVPAGAPTPSSFATAVTPSGNGEAGTFDTELDASGLSGSYEVVARACWGSNCGEARVPVSL